VFSVPSREVCFEKGDEMPLASKPAYFIAHVLVAGLKLEPCAQWERVCFRNGAHRWRAASEIPQLPAGVLVERLMDFDDQVDVGDVAAFTLFDIERPDEVGPTLALARLCSVRAGAGLVHNGQAYTVQSWQTLAIFGGSRA
jgi:hypothetical protein